MTNSVPTSMKLHSDARGFTLIELLVVIAIIGLLSAIVLASLNVARNKGYDSTRESNLRQVQTAIEAYYSDNGVYPLANGNDNANGNGSGNYGLASQCNIGGSVSTANAVITGLVPTYIPALPTDLMMVAGAGSPPAGNSCCYEYFVSQNRQNYKYMFAGCPSSGSYSLIAGQGGLVDPIHNAAWSVYTGTGTLF
jgi:prepilin-type N-terminal cleavage/methylation domain-containing protein